MFSPKCCFWGWEQSWEPCSTVPRSISFLGCHFSKFIFWSFTLFLLWLLLLKLLIFKLWFIFVYFVRYLAAMVRDWVRVCRSALFYQLSQEILDGVFFFNSSFMLKGLRLENTFRKARKYNSGAVTLYKTRKRWHKLGKDDMAHPNMELTWDP